MNLKARPASYNCRLTFRSTRTPCGLRPLRGHLCKAPVNFALARMPDAIISAGLAGLLDLFNAKKKAEALKQCKDLVVCKTDLVNLVLAGQCGQLEQYRYASHFSDYLPDDSETTERKLEALGRNGVGPLTADAKRAVVSIDHMFRARRLFAAHLFYVPSHLYWHLIYFDQRDQSPDGNHWKIGGPHIHYSRESFCSIPMEQMWREICEMPPRPPGATHVRFRENGVKNAG